MNMNTQTPLPYRVAVPALMRCFGATFGMLARGTIHLPKERIGMRVRFANGASARVYRETVVDGEPTDPCALVVEFQLWRWAIRGRRTHALFRWESLLNTPLFVGFPGFVSKLWMTNDADGVYRGVYEWDGPERAEHYARSLWRVLALGSEPGSIHYRVLPGVRRDTLIAHPHLVEAEPDAEKAWWRPLEEA
jgi:hypothetical protein